VGYHARNLPQAKEKAISGCRTLNHIAKDLEQTSSGASGKGCKACVNKAGGHFEQQHLIVLQ